MRILRTERELELSAKIKSSIVGFTYNEAFAVLSHAEDTLRNQVQDLLSDTVVRQFIVVEGCQSSGLLNLTASQALAHDRSGAQ